MEKNVNALILIGKKYLAGELLKIFIVNRPVTWWFLLTSSYFCIILKNITEFKHMSYFLVGGKNMMICLEEARI